MPAPIFRRSNKTDFFHFILICLCFVGIITNGVIFTISTYSFNVERILGIFLLFYLITDMIRPHVFYAERNIALLWIGWNATLLVSAAMTTSLQAHAIGWILTLIPLSFFWFIYRSNITPSRYAQVARFLLFSISIVCVFSIILRFSFNFNSPLLFDYLGRAKTLSYEPNIFGSTLAFLFFVSLYNLRLNVFNIILYGISAAAFLASASKGPIISLIVCLPLYVALHAIARRRSLNNVIVGTFLATGFTLSLGLASASIVEKVYRTTLERNAEIEVRGFVVRLATKRFVEKPIFGNGPSDFGTQNANLLRRWGGQDSKNNLWIGQMMVNIAHDSGIVGLIFYITFMIAAVVRCFQYIRLGSLAHAAFLVAFLEIFIASQATSVHLNAVFGIAAGLLIIKPSQRRPGAPPGSPATTMASQRG